MSPFYKLSILLAALLLVRAGYAQQQPTSAPQAFTLEQCIDYAVTNAIAAQNAILDQQIAAAKVKETVGLGLPQINGNVGLQHNEQLRRFFGIYNPNSGFSFFPNTPGANAGDILAQQSPFQLKSSGDAGININQLIFSGSYLVGLQASNAYKDLSYKTANQTKEQIIQQVTKAYYTVLISRERAKLFDNNLARVDSLLKNTVALNKNGFAESIDVDRIRVTYNNLKAEREKFLKLNNLSIDLLKFQMNYPLDQPIEVAGNIEDVKVEADVREYQSGWDYKLRPDYKVLEANQRLQQLNIKNQYAGALPTLSASANLGYFTQSNDISGLFTTNTNVSDAGTIGPDKWYSYSQFGVSMSIPIFSGLQRHYKTQQEKLTLRKVENGFKSLKQGVDLETKQAATNFENALTSLASQKENMELASNVARITKIKYEQGVGSNLEVVDAENSLRTAQTNYYSALFDAMIAKVDLDKAYGRLIPTNNSK